MLGIFIGVILGLAIAAGVALYLGRSGLTTPFAAAPGAGREAPRNGRIDSTPPSAAAEKPRFDFYRILPGAEEPKTPAGPGTEKSAGRQLDRATIEAARTGQPAPAKTADTFWLQAGAFANAAEAENLKARLALSGWEATTQSVTLPDRTTRYRVRLGPYDSAETLNRAKAELGSRGFEATIVRNP
jgi:cell division protein FtsN